MGYEEFNEQIAIRDFNLRIGDKVKFGFKKCIFTGVITKFYLSPYNLAECSIKTQFGTYSHIELRRCEKIEDINDNIIEK